jgi:hypothetical protein
VVSHLEITYAFVTEITYAFLCRLRMHFLWNFLMHLLWRFRIYHDEILLAKYSFLHRKRSFPTFLHFSWYISLSTVSCVFRILRSDLRRSCFAMRSSSVYHLVLGRGARKSISSIRFLKLDTIRNNCIKWQPTYWAKLKTLSFDSSELYVFTKSSVVPTFLLFLQVWTAVLLCRRTPAYYGRIVVKTLYTPAPAKS